MSGIAKRDVVLLVIGALLGGIVTVISTLVTGYLQERTAALQYIRNDTQPLKDNDVNTSIYMASVYSVGNKEAEGVECVVRIPNARIVSHSINPSTLGHAYSEEGDTAAVHFDMLNPGEAVTMQFLATSEVELPSKAEVTVRSKGVTGQEIGAPSSVGGGSSWKSTLLTYVWSLAPAIVVAIFLPIMNVIYEYTRRLDKRMELGRSRFKLAVQFDGDDRIKVTVLEGLGKSPDPVVMLPRQSHAATGHSFEKLRQLGEGTHVVFKDGYL